MAAIVLSDVVPPIGWVMALGRLLLRLGRMVWPDKLTRAHAGLYRGLVYVGSGKERKPYIADVLELKPAGYRRLKGRPIFTHYDRNKYVLDVEVDDQGGTLHGRWRHDTEPRQFGYAMLRRQSSDDDAKKFEGPYLGMSKDNVPLSSIWMIEKAGIKKIDSFGTRSIRRFLKTKPKKDLLVSIIKKHEGYFVSTNREPFKYKEMEFTIPERGFNPKFGKVSIPLLEGMIKKEKSFSGKRVLDVGCGSGLYAIVAAKMGADSALGLDCSTSAIDAARSNSRSILGESSKIKFLRNDPKHLFNGIALKDKYDVIVANLPFTRPVHTNSFARKSSVRYNFLGSKGLLFDFIMGATFHLADGGSIYMSFGKSGDGYLLDRLCKAARLRRDSLYYKDGPDDAFHVYRLYFG